MEREPSGHSRGISASRRDALDSPHGAAPYDWQCLAGALSLKVTPGRGLMSLICSGQRKEVGGTGLLPGPLCTG